MLVLSVLFLKDSYGTPFLYQNDVTWHEDNWDNHESKFLAFT